MTQAPEDSLPHHERIRPVDFARGIAVVLMIGAHATDAFLAGSWKENDVWYNVNILFGFVAPAFIFLSGLTLWPALLRRMNSPDGGGTGSIAYRYLIILLLGYWLQIPVLSIRQLIFNQRPDELARLFDANILQTIAIAGFLALGLLALLRSVDRARIAWLVLGIAAVLVAPYFWESDSYLRLPLPIRYYFAPSPLATFPLFPYLAYFMAGLFASPYLIAAAGRPHGRLIALSAGGFLMASSIALDPLLVPFPPHADFWGPGLQHFLFRLGGIILLVALSLQYCAVWPSRGEWLAYIGRKSLAVYILHLMLIYGSPMTMGSRYWFDGALNRNLGPLAVTGIIVLALALCVAGIILWEKLREKNPTAALWLKRLWWGLFWGLFLLQP